MVRTVLQHRSQVIGLVVLLGLLALFGGLYFLSSETPTGRVVARLDPVYTYGELLEGTVSFNIRAGELIPQDAQVILRSGGQAHTLLLSESSVRAPPLSGTFYAEDTLLNGSGDGYGAYGEKVTRPTISFQLVVTSSADAESAPDSSSDSAEDTSSSSSATDLSSTSADSSSVESVDSSSDSSSSDSSSSDVSSSDLSASETTSSDSPSPESDSSDSADSSSSGSSSSDSASSDSSSDSSSSDSSSPEGGSVTGNVVIEEVYTIDGTVSADEDFTYILEPGQEASIIQGSVFVGTTELQDDVISVSTSGREITVSTDYELVEQGFGEDFLGDYALTLSLDLASFGFIANESSLDLTLLYGDEILATTHKDISYTSSSLNQTIIEQLYPLNQTFSNETELSSSLAVLREFSLLRLAPNETVTLNMSEYFAGASSYHFSGGSLVGTFDEELLSLTAPEGLAGAFRALVIAHADENETLESNQFTVLVSSGAVSLVTARSRIVVGEPVHWVKNVSVADAESVVIALPDNATNVTITPFFTDEVTGSLLSGNVVASIELGKQPLLLRWIRSLFSSLTGHAIAEETEGDVQEVFLNEGADAYTINYYTEAPVATEVATSFGKQVTISGPDALSYENVIASATLSNTVTVGNASALHLYWRTADASVSSDELLDVVEVPAQEIITDESLSEGVISSDSNGTLLTGNVIYTTPTRSSATEVPFDAYDLDEDGYYDYMEWVVPHLSEQVFEIIYITKAQHLDEQREVLTDIYPHVSALDGYWTHAIPAGQYVRVTFERQLTSSNDITLYARSMNGTSSLVVYTRNGTDEITRFDAISLGGKYYQLLSGLGTLTSDSFDILVANGSVSFDYIVDPTSTPSIDFVSPTPTNGSTISSSSIFVNVTSTDSVNSHYTFVDFARNVVAWLRFENVTSGNPIDSGSYSKNGTAYNGAAQSATGAFGKSFTFDGQGDYVSLPIQIDSMANLTISTWVNVQRITPNSEGINEVWGNDNQGYDRALGISCPSDDGKWSILVGNTCLGTGLAATTGTWLHTAVVYSSTNVSFYVNGTHVWSRNSPATGYSGESTLQLGRSAYGSTSDPEGSCSGTATCEYGDEASCNAVAGCSANIDSCEYGDEESCNNAGCTSNYDESDPPNWAGCSGSVLSSCDGTPDEMDCSVAYDTVNTCNAAAGCSWPTLSGSSFFNGSLDEFLVFNRSLTSGEIKALYNASATQYANNFTNLNSTRQYNFTAYSVNSVANMNTTGMRTVTLGTVVGDSTAPLVTIVAPTNTTYTSLPLTFNISLNEAGTAWYSLNNGVTNYTMSGNASGTGFNATNASIADGSYTFRAYANDTSGNTNYTTNVTFSFATTVLPTTISACQLINATSGGMYVLNQSISSATTCLMINASHTSIDCQGNTITYGTDGGNTAYGINARNGTATMQNLTIKNCIIQKSASTGSSGTGILLTRWSNASIFNNTIFTNGTTNNFGISIMTAGSQNYIGNNTIFTRGTSGLSGINVDTTRTTIEYNNLTMGWGAGTTGNDGIVASTGVGNIVRHNVLLINGTGSLEGINGGLTVLNNTITYIGTGVDVHGILGVAGALIANNTINVSGVASYGIYLNGVSSVTLQGNNVTQTGSNALYVDGNTHTEFRHNVTTDNTYQGRPWYYYGGGTLSPACPSNTVVTNPNYAHLSLVGCTNVTLTNWGADGNAHDTIILALTNDSTISNATILRYGGPGVKFTTNSYRNTIAGSNITTYGQGTANYGVYAFTSTGNLTIANNTIRTNGTTNAHGIFISTTSGNNTLFNNTISTEGSSTGSAGIYLFTSVSQSTIDLNRIVTRGTTTAYGIYLDTTLRSITVTNNTVNTTSGSTHEGIRVEGTHASTITGNTFSTGLIGGTTNNRGILVTGGSANNTFTNNVITTNGTTNTNEGIGVYGPSRNNTFIMNTVLNAKGAALHLETSSGLPQYTYFRNNTLNSSFSHLEFSTAAINHTYFVDQYVGTFNFTGVGGIIGIEDTRFGKVQFLNVVNGTGTNLSDTVRIANNSVFFNAITTKGGFNKSANLTFYNVPANAAPYSISKDGTSCSDCTNLTAFTAGTVVINVSSAPLLYYTLVYNGSDTLAPTVTIVSPMNRTYIAIDAFSQFTITTNENASARYSFTGGVTNYTMSADSTNRAFNATNSTLARGSYTVTFYANDSSGNTGSASIMFVVENDLPTISFVSPSPTNGGTSNASTTLNVSVTHLTNNRTYGFFRDGLVMWYRFDNRSESGENLTNVYDWSGNGLNLTAGGTTLYNTTGQFGGGTSIAGSGNHFTTPSIPLSYGLNRSFTMSAWVYQYTTAGGNQRFFSQAQVGSPNTDFGLTSSGTRFSCSAGNTANPSISYGTVSAGQWYHIVCAYDNRTANNITLYVNGVQVNTTTLTNPVVHYETNYYVGRYPISAIEYLNGQLDELLVFNRTLSASEIYGLYNSSERAFARSLTNLSGTQNYTVEALDAVGNRNTSSLTFSIGVADTTAPVVTIVAPTNITYTTSALTFNISLNENGTAWYSLNNGVTNYTMSGNSSSTGFNATNTSIADGSYTFRAYANDTSGNTNYTTNVTFSVDTIAPTVTRNLPSGNVTSLPVRFNITTSVAQAAWYTLNGGLTNYTMQNNGNTDFNATNVSIADGSYTVRYYVNDSVGNLNNSVTFTFLVDTIAPNFTISSPTNTTYATTNIAITFTSSDTNDISARWFSNDTGNTTYSGTTSQLFSEGNHTMLFYTNDTLGNVNSTSVSFSIDSIVPAVNSSVTPASPVIYAFGQNYTFNASVSDASSIGTVLLSFNGTNYSATSLGSGRYNVTLGTRAVGSYDYYWYTNDSSGNVNQSVDGTYVISQAVQSLNLTLNSTQSNYSVVVGSSIPLTATLLTGTGNVSVYVNGTLQGSASATLTNVTTFNTIGLLNITAYTTGNQNYSATSQTWYLNVTPDVTPPAVMIIAPANTTLRALPLVFNISLNENGTAWYSLDNGATNYSMTANSSSTGFTASNASIADGSYTFRAYANDTSGNVNNSVSVVFGFQSYQQYNLSLQQGWNIISLTIPGQNNSGTDRNISLSEGWNLIGDSGGVDLAHSSVKYTASGSSLENISDAVSAGRVQKSFIFYNVSNSKEGIKYAPKHDAYIRPGRGYWVYAGTAGNLTLPNVGGTFSNATFPVANLTFTNASGTSYNITQAYSNGWVGASNQALEEVVQWFDSSDPLDPHWVTSVSTLEAWKGYVIRTNRPGITMTTQA